MPSMRELLLACREGKREVEQLQAENTRLRAENERLREAIRLVSRWLNNAVAPNETRIYCRCPICHQTWHTDGLFSRENHLLGCWVPGFKQKAADGEPVE